MTLKQPSPLTPDEIERVVEHLNYLIRRHPRVVGTLVTTRTPTSCEEITSAYKDLRPYDVGFLPDSEKMLGFGAYGPGLTAPYIDLSCLLNVMTGGHMDVVRLVYDHGVPQFEMNV